MKKVTLGKLHDQVQKLINFKVIVKVDYMRVDNFIDI